MFLSESGEIQHRDDHQREQGGHQDAEDEGQGEAVENRVVEDEQRAEHGGQRGQGDRLGTHGGGLDDRIVEVHAGRHLLPERETLSNTLIDLSQRRFLTEILIPHDSPLIGKAKKAEDIANVLAAVAAGWALGLTQEVISTGVKTFGLDLPEPEALLPIQAKKPLRAALK